VGLPVIEHSEDATLSHGGAMHEGTWSVVLGLRGIPAVSEEAIVARDIVLAEDTGARLHVAHVSTAGGVALMREGRRRGAGGASSRKGMSSTPEHHHCCHPGAGRRHAGTRRAGRPGAYRP